MFSTPENASKRYEDTAVLIGEYLVHDLSEERTRKAIARINYLHSPYIKNGKISNEDLLYTLSVFITEPIYWVIKYEWRRMTDYEICALGTFWKSVGDAMEINYKGHLKRETWNDGIDFYEDITNWAQHYEATQMVPAKTNKITADELVSLVVHNVPRALVPFVRQAVGLLMGERLRWAMMYPEPSLFVSVTTYFILFVRQFCLRYLALPRMFPVNEFTEQDPKTGRYYHNSYLVHPYYVKPSFVNRWGPTAWINRILGGVVPGGNDGERYHPEGYRFDEVGPNRKRGRGEQEMKTWEEKIQLSRTPGCPFALRK